MGVDIDPIQGLWVEGELTTLEYLSVQSFLANGHDYHLYTYHEPKNVPKGAIIKDGNEILPASSIFRYRESPSFAGFSNYFRHRLLSAKGGWWADLDMVCCRHLDFTHEYVFPAEEVPDGGVTTANCLMKVPELSAVMEFAWNECVCRDPRQIVWGETGPRLMHEAVERFSLHAYVLRPEVFCPIPFFKWAKIISPSAENPLKPGTYAVHLWNEVWRRVGADKDLRYPESSPFEQLKARYGL